MKFLQNNSELFNECVQVMKLLPKWVIKQEEDIKEKRKGLFTSLFQFHNELEK